MVTELLGFHFGAQTVATNTSYADALAKMTSTFEEAAEKWPTDSRFTKPLAMLYGTFGRGREAVRTLERYLDDRQDDRDAYFYAVQWIYTLHAGGAVVHGRAEDRQRAHDYADAYFRARGPQAALVKQWVDYLDTEK